MNLTKVLIPNKEWIVRNEDSKIGSVAKKKRGYEFFRKGQKYDFASLEDIKKELGISLVSSSTPTNTDTGHIIYGFLCSCEPFEPIYNIKKKLPLFAKSSKSKSQYCAGYYVIKFRKGWVKSFCPKLITLERYPFAGPFKTEIEMKSVLNTFSKNETT